MDLQLVTPGEAWMDSYRSLVDEFMSRGEPLVPFVLRIPAGDSAAFLLRLENCAKGIGISGWFVPHETFWLVTGDGEVVGVSNLRLSLTDALRKNGGHIGLGIRPSRRRQGHATILLEKTLSKAGERGIPRVLLTCDKSNTGSARAIQKNGGVLESEELLEGRADIVQRYWIEMLPSR